MKRVQSKSIDLRQDFSGTLYDPIHKVHTDRVNTTWQLGRFPGEVNYKSRLVLKSLVLGTIKGKMSVDIQKWKAEAHENAAKTVANMLQVGILSETYKLRHTQNVFL